MHSMTTYRLLGPIEAERDGRLLDIGRGQQPALLALLLLDAGRVVSTDRIVDALWPDDPPASAMSSIQALISRLRAVLREGSDRDLPIRRQQPGYVFELGDASTDLDLYLAGCDEVRRLVAARRWKDAAARVGAVDALYRGPLVSEYAGAAWVASATAIVDERRLGLMEDGATALFGAGRDDEALQMAIRARALAPLDERACRLHVLGLYRAGRTAEALAAWRTFADTLDEELGLEPGAELRDLQSGILRQDTALSTWPEVADRRPASALPASAANPTTPSTLVGRAHEVAQLDAALMRTAGGAEAWIVIAGAPGIGKSALAEDAIGRWASAGAVTVRVGCPDDSALPALWPIRQLLQHLGADPDTVLEPPNRDDPDRARFAIAAQVAAALRTVSSARPLLVVMDDVQWADSATATLLADVVETERSPRLAMLLTSRDDPREPAVLRLLAAVARRSDHVRLAPAPLAPTEIADLVTRISGTPPGPAELAELTQRTEGMPFFVTEYARLTEADRRTGALPSGVRAVLERRLTAVEPAVRETLQAAAVLGDPIDTRLLAATTALDARALADQLDAAAAAQLLTADRESARYSFGHALMRDRLVQAVSPLHRQELHRAAAEALAGRPGTAALARRARHLVEAGDAVEPIVVLDACVAAARDAERRWAVDEAVRWWEQARSVLEADDVPPERRDEAVVGLASALVRNGQGQRMLDLVDDSLLDAWREGRTESVGLVAALLLRLTGCWPWPAYGADPGPLTARLAGLEPRLRAHPEAHARVLAALAIGSCYDLDPAVPEALSARAIEVAETTGDQDVLADALLGRAMTFSGVAVRAQEVLTVLDRLARTPHRLERFDGVIADGIASMSTLALGDVAGAAEHVSRGIERATALHLPVSAAQFRWAALTIAQWRTDDVDGAEDAFDVTWALHTKTELTQSVTVILATLALRWEQGRLADGLGLSEHNAFLSPWIDAIVAAARREPGAEEQLLREIRRPEPTSWTSHGRATLLAHAAADLEVTAAATPLRALLLPVETCLANFGQSSMVGPIALALARLDLLAGDLPDATRRLEIAADLAQRTGGANALLRVRLERQRIAAASGEGVDPEELTRIRSMAAARGLGGVARDAGAMLPGA